MNKKSASSAKLNNQEILYLLLYFATDEGRELLPERWQFLTSEVAGGLVEYLTNQEFKATYARSRGMEDWGSYVNKEVEKAIAEHGDKICPELASVLKSMLRFEWSHDHGESWSDNQIRNIMLFGRGPIMSRTFALTVPDAADVKDKIVPLLGPAILEPCRQIAELMKKYIKQDLEFMDEHRMS
ncbi:MAG: hypothetical protein A3I26_01620 [Candidatus Yanofskybacteria bacterium RIFCSPLOWO2_02_FULL_43_10]|uniref:Uncharacterized protein n=1 Tax=Candidatus Yanofskybacteria bacterium RIFCSPLOWO2_12_FULL_43_11b TaxID=1802710 RepID=A0A1F8H9J5_9BACT|nr:MAG: hypothetical protein A2742_00980 [Candidatus Yanofskybacteria bacterium RIFCSPHIGHO2_01_FULL_43_32]OGN11920.1 MAG: hypothetical protein A3C69_02525 [Candidatus Yanofskybacteria bacterium RIFCSPHIGHO2_02_FULL_43_12]OGN24329.1 MAG: hypothetical protein A2923_00220 [Candidatus Yanofskybacteria bacterium RIFCSPLOWO2_01_FULL_43_46]OGN29459.1 MAG: hypothetical protein A3I26_01620 [Candidatus Yanofskybacteria bacterium RIFCSPLOWO2_02_FULL_43_10]OGN33626.1 MAG: hypothetical protein A3G51_01165 